MVDPESKFRNAGAERFKGYAADEMIGDHCRIYTPRRTRKAEIPHIARDGTQRGPA